MNPNFNAHLILQLFFIAAQFLVPAFIPMTVTQSIAVSTCFASLQAALGLKAYYQVPNRSDAAPPVVPPPPPPPVAPPPSGIVVP